MEISKWIRETSREEIYGSISDKTGEFEKPKEADGIVKALLARLELEIGQLDFLHPLDYEVDEKEWEWREKFLGELMRSFYFLFSRLLELEVPQKKIRQLAFSTLNSLSKVVYPCEKLWEEFTDLCVNDVEFVNNLSSIAIFLFTVLDNRQKNSIENYIFWAIAHWLNDEWSDVCLNRAKVKVEYKEDKIIIDFLDLTFVEDWFGEFKKPRIVLRGKTKARFEEALQD